MLQVEPGSRIAQRYTILEELGAGGMGTVYVAVDETFQVKVAMKVAYAAHANFANFQGRFAREARISNRLGQLPGVVRALDMGVLQPNYSLYLTMDLIESAGSLDLRGGTREERLLRVHRAASIVAAIHDHGVVHRDLKPANFLQDQQGAIFLTDFGLAKVPDLEEDATSELTMSQIAMGTPRFMPPEQFEDAKRVDARADVYALGVMLYLALTGEYPYRGEATSVLKAQLEVATGQRPAPRARDVDPELDEALDALCAEAMELNAAERLPHARALLTRLGDALGAEVLAQPLPAPTVPRSVSSGSSRLIHSLNSDAPPAPRPEDDVPTVPTPAPFNPAVGSSAGDPTRPPATSDTVTSVPQRLTPAGPGWPMAVLLLLIGLALPAVGWWWSVGRADPIAPTWAEGWTWASPVEGTTSDREVVVVEGVIEGYRPEAGLTLSALGAPVPIESDGSFQARLKLGEGAHTVELILSWPGGSARQEREVVVDASPPSLEVFLEDGVATVFSGVWVRGRAEDELSEPVWVEVTGAEPVEAIDGRWSVWVPLKVGSRKLEVTARDGVGHAAESHHVRIERLDDDHGQRAEEATPLKFGVAQPGKIDRAEDADWFRFEAEEGAAYRIWTTLEGEDMDTELQVLDPQFEILQQNDDAPNRGYASRLLHVPEASGPVWVVVVHHNTSAQQGLYTVVVEPLPADDHPNTESGATRLLEGEEQKGALDYEEDEDWFRLGPTSGAWVVSLTPASGASRALELHQAGSFRPGQETDSAVRVWVEAGQGEAFVVVRHLGHDLGVGQTYSLRLEPAAPDDHGAGVERGTPLAPGETLSGRMDVLGDVDGFVVREEAGMTYAVYTSNLIDMDSVLARQDATGTLLEEDDDSAGELASRLQWEGREGFVSVLCVRDLRDEVGGRYQITCEAWNSGEGYDDHGEGPEGATPVVPGQPITGRLEASEDRDWFVLEAEAERVYVFETFDVDTDTVLVWFDAEGHELGRDDDGGAEARASRLEVSGVEGPVYVQVEGYGQDLGRYSLLVSEQTPDDFSDGPLGAGVLSVGTPRAAVMNRADDTDWFAVELARGRRYQVEVVGVNCELRLVGSDGARELLRAQTQDPTAESPSTQLEVTAQVGGTFYVEVRHLLGPTGKNYEVVVRAAP